MVTPSEPQLAPPGAGLPAVELLIARLLFGLRRRMASRVSSDAQFARERQRIGALVRSCDADAGSRRVLIRRPAGLEDSSRYWSLWMTLDHLRIVHGEIARVITALARGIVPEGAASTAALKPSAEVGADVVDAYEASCDTLSSAVASSPNLNTRERFLHPWFGPLNAAGWHALAGAHLGIHRVQIERILAGLKSSSVAGPE